MGTNSPAIRRSPAKHRNLKDNFSDGNKENNPSNINSDDHEHPMRSAETIPLKPVTKSSRVEADNISRADEDRRDFFSTPPSDEDRSDSFSTPLSDEDTVFKLASSIENIESPSSPKQPSLEIAALATLETDFNDISHVSETDCSDVSETDFSHVSEIDGTRVDQTMEDPSDRIEEFSEVETSSSIPSKVRETLEFSWLNRKR